MAWSDAARKAAAETRRRHSKKMLYSQHPEAHHIFRREMAANLKEARSIGMRGPGQALKATRFATKNQFNGRPRAFTNVKGAQFVDQGLHGNVWRRGKWVKL